MLKVKALHYTFTLHLRSSLERKRGHMIRCLLGLDWNWILWFQTSHSVILLLKQDDVGHRGLWEIVVRSVHTYVGLCVWNQMSTYTMCVRYNAAFLSPASFIYLFSCQLSAVSRVAQGIVMFFCSSYLKCSFTVIYCGDKSNKEDSRNEDTAYFPTLVIIKVVFSVVASDWSPHTFQLVSIKHDLL